MGAVFNFGEKKVIKITTDPNEAAYCHYVLALGKRTTPKIYNVQKINKYWMIIQEKLNPLDKKKDIAVFLCEHGRHVRRRQVHYQL